MSLRRRPEKVERDRRGGERVFVGTMDDRLTEEEQEAFKRFEAERVPARTMAASAPGRGQPMAVIASLKRSAGARRRGGRRRAWDRLNDDEAIYDRAIG